MSAFGIDVDERCVRMFAKGATRDAALDSLVQAVTSTGAVDDFEALRHAVHTREEVMSTGIGDGVAIPHVRIAAVHRPVLGVGLSTDGIDFKAVDNKPVHIIVLFAMPTDSNKLYLGLLAQVMVALKVPNFVERLLECESTAEVVSVLNETGA